MLDILFPSRVVTSRGDKTSILICEVIDVRQNSYTTLQVVTLNRYSFRTKQESNLTVGYLLVVVRIDDF